MLRPLLAAAALLAAAPSSSAELPRHHRHVLSEANPPALSRIDLRAAADEIEIVVPVGVPPGQKIRVQAPNGQSIEVTIPRDKAPGQRMLVEVPAAAARPSARKMTEKASPAERASTPNTDIALDDGVKRKALEALAHAKACNESLTAAADAEAEAVGEHKAAAMAMKAAAENAGDAEREVLRAAY